MAISILDPLKEKMQSFKWDCLEINGNSTDEIDVALKSLKPNGKPKCIIANTQKNKGVPSWEKEHIHHVAGEKLFDGVKEGRKILALFMVI